MSTETPAEPEDNPSPNADPAPETGADDDPFGKPVPQTADPEEPPEPGGG